MILSVCGSLRDGSTNAAVLRTAKALAQEDIDAYTKLGELPPFNPDDDHEPLHPAVADLRARLTAADAVLICTPEYAGALPGSFKNLLDWSVGAETMQDKPVGWINASWAATGAANAHASLRIVLGYLNVRIVEDACVHIPVGRTSLGEDGLVQDPAAREAIAAAVATLAKAS
ncbi:NADPH-dependent FMN reductase [Amycolatopsis sp.]|uniref:NADPH-dependent FMN reductase n=1 Tax=Amycolatopsis sp. TaxID=37632 RepID=UPI002C4AC477|nr:NADPH-dependent FMN reductase [Amycolatopsis sp.]HVV09911.1 NADPH-dependent FMN reductase [Amycolatopsis sp.]